MTKQQQKLFYEVIKQALERKYSNLTADLKDAGLSAEEVDSKIATAMSALKNGADANSDTLKELADQIAANQFNATIPTQEEIEAEIGTVEEPTLLEA